MHLITLAYINVHEYAHENHLPERSLKTISGLTDDTSSYKVNVAVFIALL